MHQINTFQQVSAKQSIWQWLHPLRCYRKSTWFWHFFVIKPHFSPNRKIITAQCYARYLTRACWSQQTFQHFFRQFIFQRVAFERRPILLASRLPQYQRLAHIHASRLIIRLMLVCTHWCASQSWLLAFAATSLVLFTTWTGDHLEATLWYRTQCHQYELQFWIHKYPSHFWGRRELRCGQWAFRHIIDW